MRGWRAGRLCRAGLYELLGAALLTPVALPLAVLVLTDATGARLLLVWGACAPAAILIAWWSPVRRIEATALTDLLDVVVPKSADQLYLWVLTVLHLFIGTSSAALALAGLPAVSLLAEDQRWRDPQQLGLAVLPIAGAVAVMVAAGTGQRWAARRLLRYDPSRTIAELGRRQALTLELHDSVGHALSVMVVQAMAAQTALRGDHQPAVAESLHHLVATARDAQQELDVLLGVLDEAAAGQAPTLAQVGTLIGGLDVEYRGGPSDSVPDATSRAAYAIVREALTNALKHGHGPVKLDIAVGNDLVITVENRTRSRPSVRSGRGLAGMRMRARLVGGVLDYTEVDGTWRTRAELPLAVR